jgi:hypothetical protein
MFIHLVSDVFFVLCKVLLASNLNFRWFGINTVYGLFLMFLKGAI